MPSRRERHSPLTAKETTHTSKELTNNPTLEKGVHHTGPDGRIVKAPRNAPPKAGWHVTTPAEMAAAEKVEADRKAKESAAAKKGG